MDGSLELEEYNQIKTTEPYSKLIKRAVQLTAAKSASFEEYRLLKSQENIKRLAVNPETRSNMINSAIKELKTYIEDIKELESSEFMKPEIVDTLKVR